MNSLYLFISLRHPGRSLGAGHKMTIFVSPYWQPMFEIGEKKLCRSFFASRTCIDLIGTLLFMELVIYRKGVPHTILFDECDRDLVLSRHWNISKSGYALRGERIRLAEGHIFMHRLILGVTDSNVHIDHKNRNPLDNRRENLRTCTRSENMKNSRANGRSKYFGVSVEDRLHGVQCVRARATKDGKRVYLGVFKTEEDAARAFDDFAKMHYGDFANLNFP